MIKRIVFLMFSVALTLWSCSDDGTNPKVDPLQLTFQITHASSYGADDGAVDLTVTGGNAPYSFVWSNGKNTEDIDQLSAGMYCVTVTDDHNEQVEDSVEVTQPNTSTVTDIDGNIYQTVLIGNQWWMAENLRVTHDPQGNEIVSCYYNDDADNLNTYGRLYTWDVAMNGETGAGAQGIAPDGWHIPSVADWQELIDHLGGAAVAGKEMKESGTVHWISPNDGTNSSGLSILPSGEKDGSYQFLGQYSVIWTSNYFGSTQARYYTLKHDESQIVLRNWNRDLSYAIRCVKDD